MNDFTTFIADKVSQDNLEDRVILLDDREDAFGYLDTEDCTVYLITVQKAQLIPASKEEA